MNQDQKPPFDGRPILWTIMAMCFICALLFGMFSDATAADTASITIERDYTPVADLNEDCVLTHANGDLVPAIAFHMKGDVLFGDVVVLYNQPDKFIASSIAVYQQLVSQLPLDEQAHYIGCTARNRI